MGILFGLIGLIMMLAICAGIIVLVIFIARKAGILKQGDDSNDSPDSKKSINNYLGSIKWFRKSVAWRFAFIAFLVAVIAVPLEMVTDIVRDRSHLYRSVQSDVASTWGDTQKLMGPALLIPYTERFDSVEVLTDKDGNERKKNKTVYKQRTAIILPEGLNIDAELLSETRKRSIYEALVYSADIDIKGSFKRPAIKQLSDNIDQIHWDRAWLSLGVSDTQAINKVSSLKWGTTNAEFEPGSKIIDIFASGFHAPLDLSLLFGKTKPENKIRIPFSLKLNINGSKGFYFSPFGKTTDVTVKSDWPHPSFQGNILPDQHQLQSSGFNANWSVPHLARNYPQIWTLQKQQFDMNEFSAGVELFESISLYSQITRAVKYGVLFLALTYITFLLFELGVGERLHIVQYGVIGLALSLFYLTLLSMSEHAGFFKAYLISSAIIVGMISLYVFAALRSLSRTGIITTLLISLYGLLYTMLRLEDYALLAGTVMLLVVLAAMMFFTRNIGRTNQEIVSQ